MKYYFQLQYNIINRKIKAFGVSPALGFIIIIVLFFYLSNEILERSKYGTYVLLLLQVGFQQKVAFSEKIKFLKTHFSSSQFLKIRFFENMLIGIFFMGFLMYNLAFIESLISFILSVALSFISTKKIGSLVLPTPYKSKAYEFVLVFRKYWFLILISFFLMFMSLKVGNFNLGVFSLIIFGAFAIIAHVNLEPPFYVWVYNKTPKEFLQQKIKTTLLNTCLLFTPSVIILALIDISQIDLALLAFAYIALLIIAFIILKYSKYPNEINAADLLLFLMSAIVIPFFLILIPMWYKKSLVQLKSYLHDYH